MAATPLPSGAIQQEITCEGRTECPSPKPPKQVPLQVKKHIKNQSYQNKVNYAAKLVNMIKEARWWTAHSCLFRATLITFLAWSKLTLDY